jgi:hypothetical protein
MAAALPHHLGDRESGDEDRRVILVRIVGEGLRDEDAGVVDQRVDAAGASVQTAVDEARPLAYSGGTMPF